MKNYKIVYIMGFGFDYMEDDEIYSTYEEAEAEAERWLDYNDWDGEWYYTIEEVEA